MYAGPRGLTAVQCERDRPQRVQWREQLVTEKPATSPPGQTAADTPARDGVADNGQLAAFFGRIQARVKQAYVPLGIALADPWVHQVFLGFDSLPRKPAEREALIHWRLEKEWQRDAQQHALSWQALGEQDGREWIVAQTIERTRLEPLIRQAHAHRLMLSGIDSIGNLWLKRLSSAQNAALLHLQPDYWSLYVTNDRGWPVYRRSCWQALEEITRPEVFAAQLHRMLVSVRQAAPQQVVLAGTPPSDELASALAERLGQEARGLTSSSGVRTLPQEELLASQAVGNLCH